MTPSQWVGYAFESLTGWVWHRRLRRETGEVYMDRWQLLRSRKLSIYINRINMPDADDLPHNHPWDSSYSLKLKGSYIEEVWKLKEDEQGPYFAVETGRPSRWSAIPNVHRIIKLTDGKPCWTLFIGLGAKRQWGFMLPSGVVVPAKVRKAERGVTSEA
jgi:hypothetical protein